MKDMHGTQIGILKKLLFAPSLRYKELKPSPDMENNSLDFHLDQLVGKGYVVKSNSRYSHTQTGKEFANRMDTDTQQFVKQAKIGVIVCPVKEENNTTSFLIYTRLKQPFYGCQGFMSGKVLLGEGVLEAAKREFFEETGLAGIPELSSIRHYRVYDKTTQNLVEDKFLYFCKVTNPSGELNPNNEGTYEWVEKKNLDSYVTNHFESRNRFRKDIEELTQKQVTLSFLEVEQFSEKF